MTQEQKTTELNKLLQDALLKTQSVQKELTDEMTRISEESNTALHNAAKKYALEKGELQAETELYRAQVSAFLTAVLFMYTPYLYDCRLFYLSSTHVHVQYTMQEINTT